MLRKSPLWLAIAIAIATLGCAPKHVNLRTAPRVPERLQAALSATGDQKRVLFEALLRDSDPDLRLAAAKELSRVGSMQSIPALVDALRDGDIFVRTAIHRTLIQMGEPAIGSLLARLKAKDDPYRSAIASLLAASITADVERSISKELFESILAETRFVRCVGEVCIERIGVPSYPPLAKQARITGKVFVEFSLRDGHPEQITTLGHPLLIQSVINAVNEYRFTPENAKERHNLIVEFEIAHSTGQTGGTGYDFVLPNYVRIVSRPVFVETRSIAYATSSTQQTAGDP